MERFDVVILGAGAAGLFCAIEAGRRGRRVLVVDPASAAGEKIRISGGGRCNFTNLGCTAGRFISQNPRFVLSVLRRFTPADFIARLDAAGIAWHEKTLGQLFCDGPASQIVALLQKLARHIEALAGVTGTLADQSNATLARVAALVHDWPLRPVGSEGYRTAEVTLGGVDTAALDARTLESRAVPGLFFIGEVVDVTGWLGGYNFQWAWSSGWAAGQVV